MTPETKHSPVLPVKSNGDRIEDAQFYWFCDCRTPEWAEQVVRAVNSHEALVAACESALGAMGLGIVEEQAATERLRAALKRAKGEA